jgi:hypothetical protein
MCLLPSIGKVITSVSRIPRQTERKEIMFSNSPLTSAKASSTRLRGAIVGLAIGSALFGGVGIASAQNSSTTTGATASSTTKAPDTKAKLDPSQRSANRSARLAATLAPLVANGTITQTQADAVTAALVAAQPDGGRDGRGGRDGGGREGGGRDGGRGFEQHAAVVAKALGISTTELQTAMQSGKSIAAIATEKGIAVSTVISALIADEKAEHPERTDAELTAHVTDMVNGVRPTRPAPSTNSTVATPSTTAA